MLGNQWIRVVHPETQSQMYENFIYDKGCIVGHWEMVYKTHDVRTVSYPHGRISTSYHTQNLSSVELQIKCER